MGKEEDIKTRLFQSIIHYVRMNHAEAIDKAYEYFWDEQHPDEVMGGTALELGFHNFEDWLLFDYRANEEKESFIDIYMKNSGDLKEEERTVLEKIKGSSLSLYEVAAVSKDKRVLVKDLLVGGEFSLRDKGLTRGLKKGDIFAARLLTLDDKVVMSGCVYPFSPDRKKAVLAGVDKQFKRYVRNVNPEGGMKDYLKEYGDVFNLIWLNHIVSPAAEEA
ncbi:MAG: hypothetical protein M0Z60_14980 [Nitrospiraceae bacterium]|nr:hypothetical protein [Nitrospiraceae bacterium]